jgi:hypothetical protein
MSTTDGEQKESWYFYKHLDDGREHFCVPGFWEAIVSADGRRTIARSLREASDDSFLVYVINSAISFALLRLGIDQLHGTVVAADGRAFGFLGRSGYGKSSLAAAFIEAGYSILTDDMLVWKTDSNAVYALPGPSHLKIHSEVAREVLRETSGKLSVNSFSRKLVMPLNSGAIRDTPVPLKALYLLDRPNSSVDQARIAVRIVSKRLSLLMLVQCSFNTVVADSSRLTRQLHGYANLASKVPLYRISYPRRFDILPAVREVLLKDLDLH